MDRRRGTLASYQLRYRSHGFETPIIVCCMIVYMYDVLHHLC